MWIVKDNNALNTKNIVMMSIMTTTKGDETKHYLTISFGSVQDLDCKIELLDEEKPTMTEIVRRLTLLKKEHDIIDIEDFKNEMKLK